MSTIYVEISTEIKEKLLRFRADRLKEGNQYSEKDVIIELVKLLDNQKVREVLSKRLEGKKQ